MVSRISKYPASSDMYKAKLHGIKTKRIKEKEDQNGEDII
jgi:hypothetical protein